MGIVARADGGWRSKFCSCLRSAVSNVSSDYDTCPVSHRLQGESSRGKIPLLGTSYTTACANEEQRLFLCVAEEAIATKTDC